MKAYYDLHIHSALSPCGDEDMTPNNIVNMAILKGLDVIAVTDHNSCGNVRAVSEAAGERLIVVPGMEIETAEEIHMACYFPSVEAAEQMNGIVKSHQMPIKNKPEIFGRQLYLNSQDEICGEEEVLLVSATTMDIYTLVREVKKCGGVSVPAHIDRESFSILSTLGTIPEELKFSAVEITNKNVDKLKAEYSDYVVLTNSDAHYLEDISEAERSLEIFDKSIREILGIMTKAKK